MSNPRLDEALRWWVSATQLSPMAALHDAANAYRHVSALFDAARTAESAREQVFMEAVEKCCDVIDNELTVIPVHADMLKKRLRSLSPDDVNSGWYCEHCRTTVQNEHVTFEETHDVRCGGCGHPVHVKGGE
jgi:rubrerythrin